MEDALAVLKDHGIQPTPQRLVLAECVPEETGQIVDIPWDAVKVEGSASLDGLEVRELQVVMRGAREEAIAGTPFFPLSLDVI